MKIIMCVPWFGLSLLMAAVLVDSSDDCDGIEEPQSRVLDNKNVVICCNGISLESSLLDDTLINASPYEVSLVDCKPPAVSFAAILSEKNVSLPRSLRITLSESYERNILQPRIFSELMNNLLHLTIYFKRRFLFTNTIPKGFIERFRTLQTLHLTGAILPSNFNSFISELTLQSIVLGESDQILNCPNLRVLTLRSTEYQSNTYLQHRKFWLTHSAVLENLTIDNDGPAITNLLPNVYESVRFLTINFWIGAELYSWYDRMKKLERLHLTRNFLNEDVYDDLIKSPSSLKEVSLAGNSLSQFCFNKSKIWTIFLGHRVFPKEIKPVKVCLRLPSGVSFINLSGNYFKEVEFRNILEIGSENITIDLRGNPVKFLHFDEEEYYEVARRVKEKSTNITLLTDSLIQCECRNSWLAQAVRDIPSFVVKATCFFADNRRFELKLVPEELVKCTESSCYPGCSCRTQWRDNMTRLTCEGLTSMPRNVTNMYTLRASSNQIAELRFEDLPDSLKYLDLTNNSLKGMDQRAAYKLFSVPKRSILLAGNPLMCDCYNSPFLQALYGHYKQVLDYEDIGCTYHNVLRPLSNISLDELDSLCRLKTDNKSTLALMESCLAPFWYLRNPKNCIINMLLYIYPLK